VLLAQTFIKLAAQAAQRPELRLSQSAIGHLERQFMAGNVRQLRNEVERAFLLCTGDEILAEHFQEIEAGTDSKPVVSTEPAVAPAPDVAAPVGDEKQRILVALESCGGNQTRAASCSESRGALSCVALRAQHRTARKSQ